MATGDLFQPSAPSPTSTRAMGGTKDRVPPLPATTSRARWRSRKTLGSPQDRETRITLMACVISPTAAATVLLKIAEKPKQRWSLAAEPVRISVFSTWIWKTTRSGVSDTGARSCSALPTPIARNPYASEDAAINTPDDIAMVEKTENGLHFNV